MECLGIADCLSRTPKFGLGNDFQERRSGSVQIHAGFSAKNAVVALSGIFFQMCSCQIDGLDIRIALFRLNRKGQASADNNWMLELTDLIALR